MFRIWLCYLSDLKKVEEKYVDIYFFLWNLIMVFLWFKNVFFFVVKLKDFKISYIEIWLIVL